LVFLITPSRRKDENKKYKSDTELIKGGIADNRKQAHAFHAVLYRST